jgi:hypothetical protein
MRITSQMGLSKQGGLDPNSSMTFKVDKRITEAC